MILRPGGVVHELNIPPWAPGILKRGLEAVSADGDMMPSSPAEASGKLSAVVEVAKQWKTEERLAGRADLRSPAHLVPQRQSSLAVLSSIKGKE